MAETLTIHLAGPVAAVRVADASGAPTPVQDTGGQPGLAAHAEQTQPAQQLESQSQELTHLCELVRNLADKLNRLHEQTIANHRAEIARLAVEIARRVLAQRVSNGDYEIQAVIEEALKRAPTHQNVVVRVNPQDLPACQKTQRDKADGPFAGIEFVADASIVPADCLVETPRGIIRSFVEQHLERIGEALGRVQ